MGYSWRDFAIRAWDQDEESMKSTWREHNIYIKRSGDLHKYSMRFT